ncbi:helix-turn-helix domain-containing protein [Haloprofundus salinisoli]|uniref:helix-turn-helix domain-containing protein n=1 Tax=Haloprofundus salinisoli TaxID=2876193 RepID=UPI001CCF0238|nr:helix-turn-helix domain-containing protein [Haloprofundus salinisoli]
MTITVKAYIRHDDLALVPTLRQSEDVSIEVLMQANTDPDSNVFPFLIRHDDRHELESCLESDPTVEDYELVDEGDGIHTYYIKHTPDTELLSPIVMTANGFMLHAETKSDGWLVKLQLPDREALNTVWKYTEENNIYFDITEVYSNSGGESNVSYGLTDEQTEALKVAFKCGYFSEPREMTLSEVADEVGVSSTAMSGRLRRGMRNLISAALMDDDEIESR